jgi:hypothetical protein
MPRGWWIAVRGHPAWIPTGLVALAAVAALLLNGVSARDLAAFGAYVVLGVALPGTLLVRLLRGRTAGLAEDVALGLTLGYAVEIAAYLGARLLGAPLLAAAWAPAVLGGFVLRPDLRARAAGPTSGASAASLRPAGALDAWLIGGFLVFILWFSVRTFFATTGLGPGFEGHVDLPYHLALIGELRNHVPPTVPYVDGEPLAYHWFFYAEAAATSWVTGIEPATLLLRLEILPMLAAFVVLVWAAARRLSPWRWVGPLAVAITLLGTVAQPYRWASGSVFDTQTLINTWTSPTNAFGMLFLAATLVVLLDRLGRAAVPDRGEWLLLGALVLVASGAKATVLPVVAVGLLAVALHRALRGGAPATRPGWADIGGSLGLVVAALAFAVVALFRGATGGVEIGFASLRDFSVGLAVGAPSATGAASVLLPVVIVALAAFLWSFAWAGGYGVLRRWSALESRHVLLLGVGAAALGAASLLSYPGLSQLYYLRTSAAVFGLLVAAGIAGLVPAGTRARTLVPACSAAIAVGAAAVQGIRLIQAPSAPSLRADHVAGVVLGMVLPVGALLAVALAGVLLAKRIEHRFPSFHGSAPLLAIALALGFSVPAVARTVAAPADPSATVAISADAIAAARWLRDHSQPDDVVATNIHCLAPVGAGGRCDSRSFWVAAYSERRVLVEGWAYTNMAIVESRRLGTSDRTVPFWDPALLARNDLAFSAPTAATLASLESDDGVRWLFADVDNADAHTLALLAEERFRRGPYAVYRLP